MKWNKRLFNLWGGTLAVIFCSVLVNAQPHLQRGANFVTNPDFSGYSWWTLGGGALYDNTISRGTGGSVKMSVTGNYIHSSLIPVTPGTLYTLACYMRSNIWPPPVTCLYIAYYDSSQQFVRNFFGSNGGCEGIIGINQWQECVSMFRPKTGEVFAQIKITLPFPAAGYCWIDDVYLGCGIGFEQAPTAKTPFNGSVTRADELGNVEICKNGVWTPFFPICVYASNSRADWNFYSSHGFNTNMWAGSYSSIQKAKNAGMMSGFDISRYITNSSQYYNDINALTSAITDIKNADLMNSLLWYYWDNENYGEWSVPVNVTDTVKTLDTENGNRMHPVYALQGNPGVARKYHTSSDSSANITDLVGDYVTLDYAENNSEDYRGALGLIMLDNVEQQRNPLVIAQLNNGVGVKFRPRVYTAIAKGAKGIGFWMDDPTDIYAIPIENQPWWNDLPNISNEINQMLPVIRTPHWTTWSLSSNNHLIDFGTRNYGAKGYAIVTNEQTSAQAVTFTVSNLPYTATAVRNFFTNEIEANINGNNQFAVTIPHCSTMNLQGGSKVYVLESNIDKMLSLKLLCNESSGPTVNDGSNFANNGILLNGAALSGGAITLDGTNDRVNCGYSSSLDIGDLDMTITARVKLDPTQNTYAGIVTKGAGSSTGSGYTFMYYNGRLQFWLSNGTTRIYPASNPVTITDNAWHTIGVSVTRSGNAVFYVDGSSVGGSSVSSLSGCNIINVNMDLLIGSWLNSYHLRGLIDNICIYKKALSSTEMMDIAQNIVFDAQFNLSEGSATIPYDSSIYRSNGTLAGNAGLVTEQLTNDGILTLDGNGDYVDCAHPANLEMGTNDMTIVSRIKLDPVQNTYAGIVTKGAGGSTDSGYTFMYYNGRLQFWLSNGTTRIYPASNPVTITDNAWHTIGVSVTRSGNAVFYVDGSSVGSSSVSSLSGYNIINVNRNLQLGIWGGYAAFSLHGSIDYARIFKRALGPAEMVTVTR